MESISGQLLLRKWIELEYIAEVASSRDQHVSDEAFKKAYEDFEKTFTPAVVVELMDDLRKMSSKLANLQAKIEYGAQPLATATAGHLLEEMIDRGLVMMCYNAGEEHQKLKAKDPDESDPEASDSPAGNVNQKDQMILRLNETIHRLKHEVSELEEIFMEQNHVMSQGVIEAARLRKENVKLHEEISKLRQKQE